MSYKVYVLGDMIHVVASTNVDYEAKRADVQITKLYEGDMDYYFKNFQETFAPNNKLSLADIQKQDGSPYTYEEFEDFANNVNESGSGGLTNAELRAAPIDVNISGLNDSAGLATEDKQDEQINHLSQIELNTDEIEGKLDQQISSLDSIKSNTENTASRAAEIDDNTDEVEAKLDEQTSIQQNINTNIDLLAQAQARENGTFGYVSGTGNYSTPFTGGKKIQNVTVYCSSAGTITINGGSTISIPAGFTYEKNFKGILIDPTIVITGSASYDIDYLT